MFNKQNKNPNNNVAADFKKFDMIDLKRKQLRPLNNNGKPTADAKKPGHMRSLTHNNGVVENRITKNLRKIQLVFDCDMIVKNNKQAPFVITTAEASVVSPSKSNK